jgi:hypothetical protein
LADSGSQDDSSHEDLTDYGQGIGWMFGGVFFLLCAWFLEPLPHVKFLGVDLYFERAGNLLFCIFAVICLLLSFGFFARAPNNHPGLGRYLKTMLGGGEEGWRYAFLTTFAGAVASSFYGISLLVPGESGWLEWVEWLLKAFSLVAGFFIVALLAFTIDNFFIKPMLNSTSEDQSTFDAHVERFRRRATVIIPILIAVIALFLELRK